MKTIVKLFISSPVVGMIMLALMFVALADLVSGCATTNDGYAKLAVPHPARADLYERQCGLEHSKKQEECKAFGSWYGQGQYLNAATMASQHELGGYYVELALEPIFRQHLEANEFELVTKQANAFRLPGWRTLDRVLWRTAEKRGNEWVTRIVDAMAELVVPERYKQAIEACLTANSEYRGERSKCLLFMLEFRRGHYDETVKFTTDHPNEPLEGGLWVGRLVAAEYEALEEEGYHEDIPRLVKAFQFDQPSKYEEAHDVGASTVER